MPKSTKNFYESSLKLLDPLTLEQTYKIIVNEAVRLVDGAGGSVILAQKGILKRVYSSNSKIRTINPQRFGRTYNSYKNKKIINLKRKEIINVHPEFSKIKITAYILIPLINRGKSIGVLSIYKSKGNNFSEAEKILLQNFSLMASIGIRKAQLYNELHKAVETRDLFLSLASHELKTPITTIYVYLQLIQRNMKKNKKFDPNWIETLLNEMVRLTKIIDELLELSRIRTGKLTYNFEQSNIRKILDRSLVNFKATHQHSIELQNYISKKDEILIADFDKIMEVFINVLDNAAKHSPLDEPIFIKLESEADNLIIKIQDKGKGISEKNLEKVFEGFFKTSDNTKPGMGLGLYLAKQIVDAHKGKIKISSRKNLGTSVRINLPKLK